MTASSTQTTGTTRAVLAVLAATLLLGGMSAAAPQSAAADSSVWLGHGAGGDSTHMCSVRSDGRLKCWGYLGSAEISGGAWAGNYATWFANNYPVPITLVDGISNVVRVTNSYFNTCAVMADATAKCWGINDAGQIGDGTTTNRPNSPTTVPGLSGVVDIETFGSYLTPAGGTTCALLNTGAVKCWGKNNYGQVGDGSTTTRLSPVSVSGITNARDIALSYSTSCAALTTGSVKCWGSGWSGVLGDGNSTNHNAATPITVNSVSGAVQVAGDSYGFCARTSAGEIWCWGSPANWGNVNGGIAPTKLSGITGAKDVQVSLNSVCYITSTDTVKCMGLNNLTGFFGNGSSSIITSSNQLYDGTFQVGPPGVSVLNITDVKQLAAAGGYGRCARLGNGKVYCWGDNRTYMIASKSAYDAGTTTRMVNSTPLLIIELSAPPTITSPPQTPSVGSGTVGFIGDPASTHECKIDTGAWAACTSPFSYSGLTTGSHTFSVRSTEPGGSPSAAVSTTWTVDATPPVAPTISSGPANASLSPSASGSFGFTGEGGATFQCQTDGGSWTACTSPFAYSGLADGSHTFSVKAIDAVGNIGPATTRTWTIDTTAPSAPTITGKPAASTNQNYAYVSFTGESGATFQCQLDSGAWVACTNMKSYFSLADGSHTFNVKQTDAAGNVSTAATYTWTVDTTPPGAPTITSGPPAGTVSTSATLEFTGEPGATFECRIGSQPYWSACTSPKSYSNLALGYQSFQVRQKDAAGNYGTATAMKTWTIGSVSKPTITSAPSGTVGNNTATIQFDISAGNTAKCSTDGITYTTCTSPVSLTGLADGVQNYFVKQVSPLFGESDPQIVTWTIDTSAPAEPTVTSLPASPTSSLDATVAFTGDPGSTFLCSLDGAAFAVCTSPFTQTGLAEGDHTLLIKASNAAANESATTIVNWTIDTTTPAAPTLTAKPDVLTRQTTATFGFSKEAGATTECKLDSGAWAACTDPVNFSGIADGSHTFSVRQTDAAGNVSQQADWTWKVDTTPPVPPSFVAVPTSLSASRTASVTVASEFGASLLCSVDGGAYVPCSSPVSLSGLADGSHTISVKQIDAAGNMSATAATATWTVDATPPPGPSVSGLPSAPTAETTATASLSAEPKARILCSLDGGPYVPCSGSKTMSGLGIGMHTMRAIAIDFAGNQSAITTKTWTVTRKPCTAPIVTAPTIEIVRANGGLYWGIRGNAKPGANDTRQECALLSLQSSSSVSQPSAVEPPKPFKEADGINTYSAFVLRPGLMPRWVRVENKVGQWSQWVAVGMKR